MRALAHGNTADAISAFENQLNTEAFNLGWYSSSQLHQPPSQGPMSVLALPDKH